MTGLAHRPIDLSLTCSCLSMDKQIGYNVVSIQKYISCINLWANVIITQSDVQNYCYREDG